MTNEFTNATETRFISGRKVIVANLVGGEFESRLYVLSGEATGDARTDAYGELVALTATAGHKTLGGARKWARSKIG